jgi:hypothetical protein
MQREVVDALQEVAELAKPQEISRILRLHDSLLSRWKGYSLLTPGFHIRNTMGGVFNNALAGVTPRSYLRWDRAMRQMRKGYREGRTLDAALENVSDENVRTAIREMLDEDMFAYAGRQNGKRVQYGANSNVRDIADIERGAPYRRGPLATVTGQSQESLVNRLDPAALDFFALDWNKRMGGRVERFLRGPLYLDRRLNGGSKLDAIEAVAKYHFDYDELSRFEANVMRRIFPFYTWTRKNFPLQMEMMARRPAMYSWFKKAKDNIEQQSSEDPIVPAYFQDLLAIRTPFNDLSAGLFGQSPTEAAGQSPGSGPSIYLTLDLPFRDLAQTFDMNQVLAQLTPFIKTPVEARMGKQFFSGIPFREGLREAPDSWDPFMPILDGIAAIPGLSFLPQPERGPDGAWLLSDVDTYKLEQFLPLLGRTRRLVPSEEKYQNRYTSSVLSILAGVSTVTNNSSSQYGELRRRTEAIEAMVERWSQVNLPETRS